MPILNNIESQTEYEEKWALSQAVIIANIFYAMLNFFCQLALLGREQWMPQWIDSLKICNSGDIAEKFIVA